MDGMRNIIRKLNKQNEEKKKYRKMFPKVKRKEKKNLYKCIQKELQKCSPQTFKQPILMSEKETIIEQETGKR